MPKSALRYVKTDYCLSLTEIASLLARLTDEPAEDEEAYAVSQAMEFESDIAEQRMNTREFLENVERIGTRTTYTCPECNGSIWQIGAEQPLRFRCHVGHSFTADPFLGRANQSARTALVVGGAGPGGKGNLGRQMAQRMKEEGADADAMKHEEYSESVDQEVAVVRELILNGNATKRAL